MTKFLSHEQILRKYKSKFKQAEKDEELVARLLEKKRGGHCLLSTNIDDRYKHSDFCWAVDNTFKYIDVKGTKKNLIWIELKNNYGYAGWAYSHVDYFAFMRENDIAFVVPHDIIEKIIPKLIHYDKMNFSVINKSPYNNDADENNYIKELIREKLIKTESTGLHDYELYRRVKYGWNDLMFKMPAEDISQVASFTIPYNDND